MIGSQVYNSQCNHRLIKHVPDRPLSDPGTLATKIDAFIAARSKAARISANAYRRFIGWR